MSNASPPEPKSSEITPEALYLRRREFMKNAALFLGTAALTGGAIAGLTGSWRPAPIGKKKKRAGGATGDAPGAGIPGQAANPERAFSPTSTASSTAPPTPPRTYDAGEPITPFESASTYNNFYELGLSKEDPARNAGAMRPRPWTVEIGGECARPGRYDLDALAKWAPLEERVYRMRCVEAWSMVIPWLGIPLGALIARVQPTSRAKYVAFTTLLDPEQLPGQKRAVLDWPYVEGLRIDEATHPLALLAVGMYGQALPGQNGAPLRLVVPWKYGFKGIKSIVKIDLVEAQPPTTWNLANAGEYGFYANVNPAVDHPRWSQASERRIGDFGRRPTLPFNGYAAEVAHLYAGLDLRANF